MAGFENGGRGPGAKDCGQPQEAGQGKKTFFPTAVRKKCSPADNVDFSPFQIVDLQNYKMMNCVV